MKGTSLQVLGVEKFISWLKVAHLCLLSAKGTRAAPGPCGGGFSLCRIETTSCAVNAEGHLNATVGWSEHTYSSFRFSELSQPI